MSNTGENKKAVMGELLNNANPAARRVLVAYNPDLKYQFNLKNMKACKSAPIEECAKLLGLVPRDEAGKKLYQNLDVLGDRIILKIEALFEIQCDDCTETYRNKLEDTPLLKCQLCLQGSHNCEALRNKFEAVKPILELCPKGIVCGFVTSASTWTLFRHGLYFDTDLISTKLGFKIKSKRTHIYIYKSMINYIKQVSSHALLMKAKLKSRRSSVQPRSHKEPT